MQAAIVIPARYASTRFPGKPLATIAGKSMLERTWLIAKQVKNAQAVYIATDDERIAAYATAFGAQVQITSQDCQNGSERVLEALDRLSIQPEIVVNFQGDAVLTPPSVIEPLIDALQNEKSLGIATAAARLNYQQYQEFAALKAKGSSGGTLVTFDRNYQALYFSKSMIPFLRNARQFEENESELPIFRHIGIYAYRHATLKKYVSLKPTPLELVEGLEQLRALENGIGIKIVIVNLEGRTHWSVDSREDADMVEKIIAREGELVL
jgi:3-deoxy-manno-octulosonate cytidylyltransferase (CMP-KDO synthetase)